jgi:hypothetical protein
MTSVNLIWESAIASNTLALLRTKPSDAISDGIKIINRSAIVITISARSRHIIRNS